MPRQTAIRTHKLNERKFAKLILAGIFSVDDQGRIWRHKIRVQRTGTYRECQKRRAEHFAGDYFHIRQTIENGKRIACLAHRLVWQTLNSKIPKGYEINHDNGVKTDNRPTNLKPETRSGNMKHAFSSGLNHSPRGVLAHTAKFTAKQIDLCRELSRNNNLSAPSIAKITGISASHVRRIRNGEIHAT